MRISSSLGIWDGDGNQSQETDSNALDKDLELLNSMFRYMTPGQRARVLKCVLNGVFAQLEREINASGEGE